MSSQHRDQFQHKWIEILNSERNSQQTEWLFLFSALEGDIKQLSTLSIINTIGIIKVVI